MKLDTKEKNAAHLRQDTTEMQDTKDPQDPQVLLGSLDIQAAADTSKETPDQTAYLGFQVVREK